MNTNTSAEWKVSLHGGHSLDFCEHARGSFRENIEAAIAFGYRTFGIAEHAPRYHERYLFPEERDKGFTIERTIRDFDAYVSCARAAQEEFSDRIELLCGFEAETVPADDYPRLMRELRDRYALDYCVGSVHWIGDDLMDHSPPLFDRIALSCGGNEALALRYYASVARMARELKPEVIGHLDLPRKYACPRETVETPAVRLAAERALEAIREANSILDINTSGFRKGLGSPYVAEWLLELAVHKFGIAVCFGDDSHCAADVGNGVPESRQYLIDNGVTAITYLTREAGAIVRRNASLT